MPGKIKRPRPAVTVVYETAGQRPDRRQGVSVAALLLLAGSAIPIPPRQNPDFGAFGADKFLHALGHAGLAVALVGVCGWRCLA